MIEDEKIRTEMMAMQFWLRALFLHAATGTPPTSHSVQELLNELKNLGPQDGSSDLAPADWDEEHLVHYPSFERVGMKIIETLLSLEKKLSS